MLQPMIAKIMGVQVLRLFIYGGLVVAALLVVFMSRIVDDREYEDAPTTFSSPYVYTPGFYENPTIGVSFSYPQSWKENLGYENFGGVPNSYKGEDGYLKLETGSSANIDDEVNALLRVHCCIQYGENPLIRKKMIAGQPARIIQATQPGYSDPSIIIKLPTAITTFWFGQDGSRSDDSWGSLWLQGDPDHFDEIIQSIRFIPVTQYVEYHYERSGEQIVKEY